MTVYYIIQLLHNFQNIFCNFSPASITVSLQSLALILYLGSALPFKDPLSHCLLAFSLSDSKHLPHHVHVQLSQGPLCQHDAHNSFLARDHRDGSLEKGRAAVLTALNNRGFFLSQRNNWRENYSWCDRVLTTSCNKKRWCSPMMSQRRRRLEGQGEEVVVRPGNSWNVVNPSVPARTT